MLSKYIIIGLLIVMLISLGVGLYHLLKAPNERDRGDRVVRALTWRIGIWVVLFIFIIAAVKLDWIKPSQSINPAKFQQEQQERADSE